MAGVRYGRGCVAEVKGRTKVPEIEQLAKVFERAQVTSAACAGDSPVLKCKMTGLTLESCSHQWIVTCKAEQFACGKETKISEVSTTVPPGFPTVPNGHENAAVAALARRSTGASAMVTLLGRIVGTWPPVRRDTEWKPPGGGMRLLTFYDFAINDGTGQLDVSVQGETWEARLKQLKAKTGDLLCIFDMKAKWEPSDAGGVVSMNTIRDRDPVLKKLDAAMTKRVFAAADGPVLSKAAARGREAGPASAQRGLRERRRVQDAGVAHPDLQGPARVHQRPAQEQGRGPHRRGAQAAGQARAGANK